jgi:hypothetical protein
MRQASSAANAANAGGACSGSSPYGSSSMIGTPNRRPIEVSVSLRDSDMVWVVGVCRGFTWGSGRFVGVGRDTGFLAGRVLDHLTVAEAVS